MHVENTHWKKVWSIRGMNHAFHPSKIIRSIYSGVCLFVCLLLLLLLLFFNESSEILWSSTSPLESFFDSPQLADSFLDATPFLRFFWNLPYRIKHQHLTFSVTLRSSLARILKQVQWWSVSMVTRDDVLSSRWSSLLSFFNFFSTTKVNLVAKSCKVLIYVLLFISSTKKIPFLGVLTWFLILGKIYYKMTAKMATIVVDITGLQQRHNS